MNQWDIPIFDTHYEISNTRQPHWPEKNSVILVDFLCKNLAYMTAS